MSQQGPGVPNLLFWLIPNKLAGSPIPSRTDLELWKSAGISSIVSLVEEFEFLDGADVKAMKQLGFDVLWVPIPDMTAPTIDQLFKIVKWIDSRLSKGKKVVVHCYGGYGRTGTILAAYLIYKGSSADEAIREVRRVRPRAIQTLSQEAVLYEFEEIVKKTKSQT